MRINKVAVLIRRADTVRIAIGAQACVAMMRDRSFAKRADMRLNRLGIDARKQRINISANLHMIHADARKDVRQDRAPSAIHRVNGELHPRLRDQVQIRETLNRLQIRRQKINLFYSCGPFGLRSRLVEI